MVLHIPIDVLCIGHASYDLVFSILHHPEADEKMQADTLLGCGGGPAANAAITIAKLGFRAGFCGYLGNDVYGNSHYQELQQHAVDTQLVVRGTAATPLSAILVKPDGKRALINYKGDHQTLAAHSINFKPLQPKVILFDGHESELSLAALNHWQADAIPSVLDAGSLHAGTLALMDKVDYLVCSEKFARQYAGDEQAALNKLAKLAKYVVITLGERGLIWQHGQQTGTLSAPPVTAIDSTGAGDAFHGAFAAALAAEMDWETLLRYASAAGAYCCTQMGARPGLPTQEQHQSLLDQWQL